MASFLKRVFSVAMLGITLAVTADARHAAAQQSVVACVAPPAFGAFDVGRMKADLGDSQLCLIARNSSHAVEVFANDIDVAYEIAVTKTSATRYAAQNGDVWEVLPDKVRVFDSNGTIWESPRFNPVQP
ncbi:MAG: hypothetical protein AAFZ01_00555 [Pseudomonadota bacterium]